MNRIQSIVDPSISSIFF